MSGPARHAVYWAPEASHPLWSAGCAWLGRDPRHGAASEPPPHRRAPWRYGFHATLKPPMALREGAAPDDFVAAVAALAAGVPSFGLPPLHVAWLDGFIALRPQPEPSESGPLHALAARCVRELDGWRRPPAADAPPRRDLLALDARQRRLLADWGYPQVLDRWRFHLTLSDPLAAHAEPGSALFDAARRHFAAALAVPLAVQSVCVFVETAPGAPLRLWRRCPLAGAGTT